MNVSEAFIAGYQEVSSIFGGILWNLVIGTRDGGGRQIILGSNHQAQYLGQFCLGAWTRQIWFLFQFSRIPYNDPGNGI